MIRRSHIGSNTHNYCQLARIKMVSSILGNRDQGNDQYFHVNHIKLHRRSGREEVMERTRQLFNTMNAEMPQGMLEMSVGAGQEQEGDKSKYPMHFQGHN